MGWKTVEEASDWSLEASITVKGPKEGPVTFRASLPNTTQENALRCQQAALALLVELNEG